MQATTDFVVMPSNVQTDDGEQEENMSNNHHTLVNKNSHQYQTPGRVSKGKAVSPRGIRSVKLQDKRGFLMSGKPIERNSSDHHSSRTGRIDGEGSVPCVCNRKPWPSRKASGGEELVKHMSNIPSFLQRMESGDNVQGKALNFGVIDWGRLEQWAYGQKQAVDGRVKFSPPTSRTSSLSTSGSATQSCRSIGSPLSQRKKSPSLNGHQDPSAKARQTKMMEEDSTKHVKEFLDSRTSHVSTLIGHHQISGTDCNIGTNHSELHHEKSKRKDISTSDPTPKDCGASGVASNNTVNVQDSRSKESKKPQEQHLFSKDIEGMPDHLQESTSGRHSSVESTTFSNRPSTGVRRNSFSVNFLSEDVPHSCPLPSTIQRNESEMEVLVPQSRGAREFLVSDVDRLGLEEAKGSTTIGRELSSSRHSSDGLNWMKRSSSFREFSSVGQMKWTASPDNSHGDKAAANSRGRRSPLRRILDPLLKSKNHTLFPRPIAESSVDHRPPMPEESTSTINSSDSQSIGNLNSSSSHGLIQDETHMPPTRQALLQLSWKNGMPVLMLSSDDNNILAATMRKKNVTNKSNFECTYTILAIHEVKKKSGVWMINQRNKSKKNGWASNVVGQLKVLRSELKSNSVVSEFVLFGAELTPAAHEPISSVFKSELAAIIVEVPKERSEITLGGMLKRENCWDSSPTSSTEDRFSGFQAESSPIEQYPKNSSFKSITALLPSVVHGSSATGEPSSLIERWKSGGNCDCGGWDEGCILTILSDKIQGLKSTVVVQASPITYGAHQIELFVQGGVGQNRHAFSMVACKEGLYTVEFRTSIALLQAFAICIATLHDRKPTIHFSVHDSKEAISFQEQVFAEKMKAAAAMNHGGAPTSYVPHHPPLSPVGRA